MKKLCSCIFLVAISIAAFCSVSDSSARAALVSFGVSPTVAWVIVGGIGVVLGHVAIPNKFASVLYYLQLGITWINEKTNNGQVKNFYKKSAVVLVLVSLSLGVAHAQIGIHKWYPFTKTTNLQSSTGTISISNTDSTLYFGASASVTMFTLETKTDNYELGAVPGVGYGIKYNPYLWSKPLLSVDLYLQAGLTTLSGDKYFKTQLLPVIGVLGWGYIGYGYCWRIGVDGASNNNSGVLVIGANIRVNAFKF
jgi:hypothetical protein